MIDTHTHIQFKALEGKVDEVIKSAQEAGIEKIIVVGTNLETSSKAVELTNQYNGLYASVGIHPHHVFSYCHPVLDTGSRTSAWIPAFAGMTKEVFRQLEQLLRNPKVVAIGETGLDRHIYETTQYKNYQITEEFIELQKLFYKEQIKLAIKYQKSLIIHNRKAVPELLEILEANWDPFLEGRSVFHFCEPDPILLAFTKEHNIFIGVDGDITYDLEKQEFIKNVPLGNLVLETDSPFVVPEPLKSEGIKINEPKNLQMIAELVAGIKEKPLNEFKKITTQNSLKLFNI